MKFSFLLIGLSCIHPLANAVDLSMTYGAHNLYVHEKQSHTFGANIGIIANEMTDSGTLLNGSLTVLIANNKDKLDPDYDPIWYIADAQVVGNLYPMTSNTGLDWLARLDIKNNTVSGIEKQHKLFTGIGLHYTTPTVKLNLKTLIGYYLSEIDDDVPFIAGYAPDDLSNKTTACTLIAESKVKLNSKMDAYARVQQYRDDNQWLENQYALILNHYTTAYIDKSTLTLSMEHSRYNLDPYQKIGLPPILPWSSDTLIRLYISVVL